MNPLEASAQFAAYVWYTKRAGSHETTEAAAFAKTCWPQFLPVAHEGLGRLLREIAAKKNNPTEKDTSFKPKVAKLKTLAAALRKPIWPLAS